MQISNKYHYLLEIIHYFPIGKVKKISQIGQRKINQTYLIETSKGKFILQRMHLIFKWELLKDIDKVTKHLSKSDFTTPLIIKTKNNKLGLRKDDKIWRVLSYIPGRTIKKANNKQIESAAKMVGKFHTALSTLKYDFKFHIPGFHETDKTMEKLKKVLKNHKKSKRYAYLSPIATEVLFHHKRLKEIPSSGIKRVIHDDLRIENIVFNEKGDTAICAIDFDTVGSNEIMIELGDIIRSWTNKSNELDVRNSAFDFVKYQTFLKAYLSTAKFLTKKELFAIPLGIEKITLDLIARFLIDAFEEKYFRLAVGFKDLYTQNRNYAKAQMRYYKSFKRNEKRVNRLIEEIANSLF